MPFHFEHQACGDETSRNFQDLAEHMKDCKVEGAEFGVRFEPQVDAQKRRREAAARVATR